jgi:hypothetical protein
MDDDFRTYRDAPVAEATSAVLTGRLVDATGAPVPGPQLSTLTLTLVDRDTGNIVNGRNATDILNANGGEVDVGGNLSLTLTPDDTALIDAERDREGRIARLAWTWNAGNVLDDHGVHEVWFDVVAL